MLNARFVPIQKWPGEPTKRYLMKRAQFRASYGDTLRLLEHELGKLDAGNVIVQAFFREDQIRNDGWPRSNVNPSGPGIIISFRTPQGPLSFPCDRFDTFDDNMRAIGLSLQALRAVDRYGVTKRAEQYQGWKQIGAPTPAAPVFANNIEAAAFINSHAGSAAVPHWMSLIEFPTVRQVAYREAAKRLHPDSSAGDHELFVKLQQAMEMLEK
jgi:hypothetical protein